MADFSASRHIALATLVVDDYDKAKAFYCDILGFDCVSDQKLPDGKRWVVVTPKGSGGMGLLLAQADGAQQHQAIGNQTGGRVGFFLHTQDFATDFTLMTTRGVRFLEQPRHEAYGSVAVFEDPYGNKWDLLQPRG
ncbi:VOC family protein [Agrobacterium rosae]|uniref:Methylmalonyl-CoA epimerase n=1 Tax=Agrobacterium rosae TaxID=1972867 RepID=A0A1R3TKZ3_9HYPH|nr:VOC family protein [Agrobacterium rosae]SCX21985.1 methylmalonyl-CoA epimerase [Agrobacterium rosae]